MTGAAASGYHSNVRLNLCTESRDRLPMATSASLRSVKPPHETRTRILDAAEELFMQHGFEGTSMRQLTTRAGVNLAAVNYHFGSKDALIEAVFRRRLDPMNAARIAALDELEQSGRALSPEAIIRVNVGSTTPMRG